MASTVILLRTIAFYLIGLGIIVCLWPFIANFIDQTEAKNLNLIQTAKYYVRELCLALAFIIGGMGILQKQLWARKVCLTALALAFFYGGNKIAWLWAGNAASITTLVSAYSLSFLLFGICFLLLFKNLIEGNLKNTEN